VSESNPVTLGFGSPPGRVLTLGFGLPGAATPATLGFGGPAWKVVTLGFAGGPLEPQPPPGGFGAWRLPRPGGALGSGVL
jgi:hypothetical protein